MNGKRIFNFTGDDEVGIFYVVTFPNPESTLEDIMFDADVFDMALQLKGGLQGEDIVGLYTNRREALAIAKELMATQ